MKYLLTSGGVTNPTIRAALEGLLPKPIGECRALVIPTAQWGHPMCGPASALAGVVDATGSDGPFGVGWASVGLLELTALPSIDRDRWTAWVRDADVLLVDGGDAAYLAHWMRESGVAELLPSLTDTVWVGMSAGSMALTPRIGKWFVEWSGATDDRTLGLVDFSVFPHLDVFPTNTIERAETWAAGLGGPAYVMDDETAVVVDGERVEVVSEGRWARLGVTGAE